MKKIKFLAFALIAMAVVGLASCKGTEEEDIQTYDLTNATPYVVSNYDYTPTAAYGVSFTLGIEGDSLMAINGLSSVKDGFTNLLPSTAQFASDASIVDFGKARKVSSVDEIPTTGYASKALAQEGHGYVMKIESNSIATNYPNATVRDPETMYVRFIITEATENGYKIAVEYPFEVTE